MLQGILLRTRILLSFDYIFFIHYRQLVERDINRKCPQAVSLRVNFSTGEFWVDLVDNPHYYCSQTPKGNYLCVSAVCLDVSILRRIDRQTQKGGNSSRSIHVGVTQNIERIISASTCSLRICIYSIISLLNAIPAACHMIRVDGRLRVHGRLQREAAVMLRCAR